jgi:hypothetical protein
VTLRITPLQDDEAVLRIEGHLGGDAVRELERATTAAIAVDAGDLRSADPDGLAALRELRALGIEIRNASPYLAMVLD